MTNWSARKIAAVLGAVCVLSLLIAIILRLADASEGTTLPFVYTFAITGMLAFVVYASTR